MALASFADLKTLLKLEKAALADYPALSLLIDSVDAAIANYLGRNLVQDSYTETLHIYGPSRMIPLAALPVAAITSVAVDGDTLDASGYKITGYGVRLAAEVDDAEVIVQYDGGPATPHSDWVRAALMQTAYEYQNKDHVGAESVSTDGGTVNRPALSLLKEVRRMLDPHVHPLKTVM